MPNIKLIVNGRRQHFCEALFVPQGMTYNQYLTCTIGPFFFDDYNVSVNGQSAYKKEHLEILPKEGDKVQVTTTSISGSGPYPVISFSLYYWAKNWSIYFAMKSMKILHCEFKYLVVPVFFKVFQSTFKRCPHNSLERKNNG